jgi:hypothetical protein
VFHAPPAFLDVAMVAFPLHTSVEEEEVVETTLQFLDD